MTTPTITVDGIGKKYRLGLRERRATNFREAMTGAVTAPLRRFRQRGERMSHEETFWALQDVSFDVQPGEVVGVIGRNGAGKSTLLKILSRITEPTTGVARMRGRVASLLEVGTGFHPELTGRENIYLNGAILGMRKTEIDRKFDEIVDFSEVEKFLDTPVKRYSSGMYVRLAFAVAAHLEPEILIVDEVLAVGDASFQKKCLGKMRDVSKGGGRTVLFVSHNMATVEALCTRCILLEHGQLRVCSSVEEVVGVYISGNSSDSSYASFSSGSDSDNEPPARFESAELLDLLGDRLTALRMGDGFQLQATVLGRARVTRAYLGFSIVNAYGVQIAGMHSGDTAKAEYSFLLGASTTVRCSIPSLNLMPGSYTINLILQDAVSRRTIAFQEQALALTIEPKDVYGTGKVPRGRTVVYFDGDWSSENTDMFQATTIAENSA